MMPRANERIFTARPPDEHFVPPAQDTAWRSLCSAVDLSAIFDAEQGQPHSQCMENTRVALRESLRQVLDRHDRTNVWLKGLAGVGKTTIAFTVAKEMKSTQRLAASFFFSRKNVQRATMFIPTIAYQLALAFPRIKADIVKAIEEDEMLLSSKKSRRDQAQELIIKPLYSLRFRQAMSYVIVIDALDECFSTKEAAKLVELLIEMLSGADLPNIHLLFTSRPETHIRAAMQAGVHEISLITGDEATLRDVRVFLRVSLDNIRTNRPDLFGQLPRAWPSEDDFEALASRADGLFVYAALVIKFLSATGHQPQRRLSRLLRDSSAVNADLDQLYRQILTTSKNSIVHCRMLTCIIHLYQPLSLAKLQELFHEDEEGLAVMLEAFSPVILNPPLGNVEIYHSSLFDFMGDRRRSKQYYLDRARAHEYLACCCLKLLMQKGPMAFSNDYAFVRWDYHLSKAYPSSKLRNLLALFTKTELQRLVADALAADPLLEDGAFIHLMSPLHTASRTCLSFKWIRSPSDVAVAWRIVQASRKVKKAHSIILKQDNATERYRLESLNHAVRTQPRSESSAAAQSRPQLQSTQAQPSTSSQQAATSVSLPAASTTAAATSSRSRAIVRRAKRARIWTRFLLCICCASPAYTDGRH